MTKHIIVDLEDFVRLQVKLQRLEEEHDLLELIRRYDCRPSDIAEVVKIRTYSPTHDYKTVGIKLKKTKMSLFDKIKGWYNGSNVE